MSLVPDLLTIEEAARVLRIGRTKAYAMGQEWRVTDGQSGIKVREFGGQLRVPRVWIEEQLGAPLRSIPQRPGHGKAKPDDAHIAERAPEPTPHLNPSHKNSNSCQPRHQRSRRQAQRNHSERSDAPRHAPTTTNSHSHSTDTSHGRIHHFTTIYPK